MEIGFVGLGRMGLNMSRRLLRGGHRVVGWSRGMEHREPAQSAGVVVVDQLPDLVPALQPPRAIWLMIPAGPPVDQVLDDLLPRLSAGDLVVDGGNSNYRDSRRRHERLAAAGVAFVDAGTSGGIWGLENGFCLMVGGDPPAIARLTPVLETLAPSQGWMHVGPAGAGHYVKMIHNGIEYGMMQAYAEGFEILHAGPYRYDLAGISRLWNQGSVVRSWLLELAGRAFAADPDLKKIRGYVEDSGEGRWTVHEAIDLAVPAPVITLALLSRFRSRQPDSFRDKVLAALRNEFGGHAVREPER